MTKLAHAKKILEDMLVPHEVRYLATWHDQDMFCAMKEQGVIGFRCTRDRQYTTMFITYEQHLHEPKWVICGNHLLVSFYFDG